MTYKYEVKYDAYSAIDAKYLTKIELGISNLTEKNCDIKFEKLLDNTLNYMGV